MFIYVTHCPGLSAACARRFSTWREASDALDAALHVLNERHGQVCGGHIEEHVPGIGWIVSNEEPELSAFPDEA